MEKEDKGDDEQDENDNEEEEKEERKEIIEKEYNSDNKQEEEDQKEDVKYYKEDDLASEKDDERPLKNEEKYYKDESDSLDEDEKYYKGEEDLEPEEEEERYEKKHENESNVNDDQEEEEDDEYDFEQIRAKVDQLIQNEELSQEEEEEEESDNDNQPILAKVSITTPQTEKAEIIQKTIQDDEIKDVTNESQQNITINNNTPNSETDYTYTYEEDDETASDIGQKLEETIVNDESANDRTLTDANTTKSVTFQTTHEEEEDILTPIVLTEEKGPFGSHAEPKRILSVLQQITSQLELLNHASEGMMRRAEIIQKSINQLYQKNNLI